MLWILGLCSVSKTPFATAKIILLLDEWNRFGPNLAATAFKKGFYDDSINVLQNVGKEEPPPKKPRQPGKGQISSQMVEKKIGQTAPDA